MRLKVVFLLLFLINAWLGTCQTIIVNKSTHYTSITPSTKYLVDESDQRTIQDILKPTTTWEALSDTIPNFGFLEPTLWTTFSISKLTNGDVFLYLPNSPLTSSTLYKVQKGVVIDSTYFGALQSKDSCDLYGSSPIVLLHQGKTEKTDYFLKTKSTVLTSIDYYLADAKSIQKNEIKKHMLFYFFFGIMMFVVGYTLIIRVSESRMTNIMFSGYVLFLTLVIAYLNGFHIELLSSYMIAHYNLYSSCLMVLLILCIYRLTKVKRHSTLLYYCGHFIIGSSIVSAVINIMGELRIANMIMTNISFFGCCIGLILGVILLVKKEQGAFKIFTSFLAFISGITIYLLVLEGYIPNNYFTFNASIFGSLLQIILLLSFFSTQLKSIRKSKKEAQLQLLKETQKNEALVSEQKQVLEKKVKQRTLELEEKNKDIKHKNEKITSGIRYASYIQKANLQETTGLKDIGVDGFISHKPKEILGGDFYFYASINEHLFFITADCTGHGVHGSLLAITGHSILRELIHMEKLTEPAEILSRLNKAFYYTLRQGENNNKDGMDISVVVVNKTTHKLHYSGALNPLVYIQENNLHIIKGNRYSVGGSKKTLTFSQTTVDIQKGIQFYIYSDGYQDQFSEANGKKFMSKKFRDLLFELSVNGIEEQKNTLESTLINWKGREPQTDDILVMGISLKPLVL